ncbi:MAG: hypothetical protein R3Y27_05740 [Clostridia bacterium]
MKKIILRIFLVILALIVIGVAAFVVLLTYNPNSTTTTITSPTVTDADGNSYLAVEDEQGVTYAAVTDAAGNIYAAEILPDGTVGDIVADLNGQVDLSDLPTTTTAAAATTTTTNSGSSSSESVTVTQAVTDAAGQTVTDSAGQTVTEAVTDAAGQTVTQIVTTASTTTSSSDSSSTGTTDTSGAYRIAMYQEIFASGEFLLSFYTDDDSLGSEPITAAMDKAGNIIIDANIDSMSCQMLYLVSDDTTYLVVDDWSKYCELPESLMEDMDLTEMMSSLQVSSNLGEITVTTFVEDGVTYTQESYYDSEGYQIRYIFLNDEWVKRENDNADGTVSTTYVVEATGTVPAGTFDIPSSYGYLNLSWLGFVM